MRGCNACHSACACDAGRCTCLLYKSANSAAVSCVLTSRSYCSTRCQSCRSLATFITNMRSCPLTGSSVSNCEYMSACRLSASPALANSHASHQIMQHTLIKYALRRLPSEKGASAQQKVTGLSFHCGKTHVSVLE